MSGDTDGAAIAERLLATGDLAGAVDAAIDAVVEPPWVAHASAFEIAQCTRRARILKRIGPGGFARAAATMGVLALVRAARRLDAAALVREAVTYIETADDGVIASVLGDEARVIRLLAALRRMETRVLQ